MGSLRVEPRESPSLRWLWSLVLHSTRTVAKINLTLPTLSRPASKARPPRACSSGRHIHLPGDFTSHL